MDILTMLESGATGTGRLRLLTEGIDEPLSAVWRRSADASRWLAGRIDAGGAVAGILTPSMGSLAALVGAWRCGLRFVSLPLPARAADPETYVAQLRSMCAVGGASTILLSPDYAALVPADAGLEVTVVDEVLRAPGSGAVDRAGGWLVQFSSGSTGSPKGVALSLESVGANVGSILSFLDVQPGDAVVSWLPLSHDMGLIGMALGSLAAGAPDVANASLSLLAPEAFLRNPGCWLQACGELGGTITGAPNFAFDLAVRALRSQTVDLSRLRVLITGGERVRGTTLRAFEEAAGPEGLAPTALCPAYGMAEATLAVTMVPPTETWSSRWVDGDALGDGAWQRADAGTGIEVVSNGVCLDGMDVRVDGRGVGELQVAGPSIFDRYLGATRQLVDDRWIHTADLGAVEDGETFVLGRSDDVILIGGRNYYATDLEAAVDDAAIRSGNAVAVPSSDGRYALLAEPARDVGPSEARAACARIRRTQVRRVGTAPTAIVFVERGTILKTSSGKVRRSSMAAAFEADGLHIVERVDFGADAPSR